MNEDQQQHLTFGKTIALLAMAAAFVVVVGFSLADYRLNFRSPLKPTTYPGQWICASGESARAGFFRKRFDLSGHVKHAWIKIAATDAFEISVNKNPLGRTYLWRPTRPFQTGVSEKGQYLADQEPALALNFPREYQWSGHDSWRLPTYLEITSSFKTGKNVVTIEVESRAAAAKVSFVGEIQMHDGRVIPIRSDASWRGESAIPGIQDHDWTEVDFRDTDWRQACLCEGPQQAAWRNVPEPIYCESFSGSWLRHPDASNQGAISFETTWNLPQNIDEAWLRLITNRTYELFINGQRVRVASNKPIDLDHGEWIFGRTTSLDPTSKPELLDPDEVGSNFVGDRFETPRKGHRNLGEFRNPFSPKLTPFRYIRTYNRAQAPGVWDPKRTLAESRRTPETPDLFPERPKPNSLKRNSLQGGYLSYSVGNLLQPGKNSIEVRCLAKKKSSWATQIAIDGGAILENGQRANFVDDSQWVASDASHPDPVNAKTIGQVSQSGKSIPAMQYRGNALAREQLDTLLPETLLYVTAATITTVVCVLLLSWFWDRRRPLQSEPFDHENPPLWYANGRLLFAMMLTATVGIGTGLLVECAWTERHEIIWSINGSFWKIVFATSISAAILIGALELIGRRSLDSIRVSGHETFDYLRRLPDTKFWFHLCLWVLLLGVFLRAYKLDLQPLDDDEYASTQAIMAILETGVPGFVPDDVHYTRSPLFHYLTAAIAWPFGGNLWSLRLQSVFWGVATAWLTYLCGSKLLNNPWIGFVAMTLLCIHPFEIFTGHVIRFYQMQQFFAMLTVYLFCRGFVSDQSQGYRIATLVAFLAAVLSQEISVAMGPSLLLGYFLFAKDLGWKKNISLALLSGSIMAIIALDFFVFQTLCLTRTEGISPSVEAAVKPHFWYPMNFFSMLIGYSRLHVVASFFLIASIPLLWRERNKNAMAMLCFLVSGVVMTNLLVTTVSFRYQYWLIPIWLLLSVDGLRLLLTSIVSVAYPIRQNMNRHATVIGVCFVICVSGIVASWSPWRMVDSYELTMLGDSTGAMRWVSSRQRPGDRVAVTEPHTHCAFMESGKCDYDIALPLLYDFALMQDGILVDRNGGGEVVSNVDQLIEEFANGERIWILLNREKFRTRGKNMRWEYPGARFETFIRKNCELKHRTYLWSVYLWDPSRGQFEPFRIQE